MFLLDLNLIAVLNLYLVVVFILSTVTRYRLYRAMFQMVTAVPGRWPRLFALIREHQMLFLTWPTLVPVALTFLLMLVHTVAYQFIWPAAEVTVMHLARHWMLLGVLMVSGCGMLYLDYQACFNVWQFDRAEAERYFDQAEYWLQTPWAPTIKVLTFGFINPRAKVRDEVTKALTSASGDLNRMMWRWALQIGMRLVFGLSLWLTWALGGAV